MSTKLLKFVRRVNNVTVEQKIDDGFTNGTSMSVAHGKDISDWLALDSTLRLVAALAKRLGIKPNSGISPNSVKTRVSATYPSLVQVKRGSPENGGGTWIHPKLAVHLAQWCNEDFALLVSDWIEEWMTTGRNPVQVDVDQEFIVWQQRHDIRVFLKDYLRPELMDSVVRWAIRHGANPIKLASGVHDAMNQRIQGLKSQEIKLMNGLPLGSLIRDYFDAPPLVSYVAINKLAKNAIEDRGIEPIQAVHEACDSYLGASYRPKPAPIAENVYTQGRRLTAVRKEKQLRNGVQLSLLEGFQAS
jgi:hypothetical protein